MSSSWTVKPRMSIPRIALGVRARLVDVGGDLDPAGLAAPADLHLRLDDARVADLLGERDGVLDGRGGAAGQRRHAVALEELLALVLEEVHRRPDNSPRARGAADRAGLAGRRARAELLSWRRNGATEADQSRHLRCLRDAHRLGAGHRRCLRYGSRPRRLHDRPRRADPQLPRDRARDRGRLLRALRRGPAPHGRRDLQARRLAAGALALGLSARQRAALAAVQGDQRAAQEGRRQVPDRACISNIDDKLLGQTRRHIPHDFDLVVTAQQVRSYKPDMAHFTECARRMGTKKGWVHISASYYHDVEPAVKNKIPVIWVNRSKETLEPGQKKPTAEVKNLAEAVKLLGL